MEGMEREKGEKKRGGEGGKEKWKEGRKEGKRERRKAGRATVQHMEGTGRNKRMKKSEQLYIHPDSMLYIMMLILK